MVTKMVFSTLIFINKEKKGIFMKRMFVLIMLLFGLLANNVVYSQISSLVINEIFYNPPNGSDDTLEFIELYNYGNEAVNVMGYKLKSPSVGSTNINVTLPDVVIQPKGFMVLSNDSVTLRNLFNIPSVEWNQGKSLNNTTKDVVLFDGNDNVVDSVTYSNKAPWPAISSSGGPSIELLSHSVDNTDGIYWEKSQQVKYVVNGQDTLLTLYCSPGTANVNQRPIVQFSSDKQIITPDETVAFTNESSDYDTLSWTFEGGDIDTSQEENPEVTYSSYGMFNVGLYVGNAHGDITLLRENYIVSLPSCPLQTQLPYTVDFYSLPDCWFSYPASGDGMWNLDNNYGYNDDNSIKFDCANYSDNARGTIYTEGFDLSQTQQASFSFYYSCPGNQSTNTKSPLMVIRSYSADYDVINEEEVYAKQLDSWALFTMDVSADAVYFSITVENKSDNNAVFIDEVVVQDRPANSCLITGVVSIDGVPLSDIQVQVQPGDISVVTDGNGSYMAFVEKGWSGTVKPSNPQYVYTPSYMEYVDLQTDVENVDFEAVQLPSGWVYAQTANSHTFCIPQNAIDTEEVGEGSWIGVFYENEEGNLSCCGAMQYTGESTMCMNAWAANPSTGDLGFTEGQTVHWKIFENVSSQEYDAIAEYVSGQEVFTVDGITTLGSLVVVKILQTVVIPSGWNGISSYVIPNTTDLTTLLNDYADDVVIMMNNQGSYIPYVNSEVTQWDANQGWLIKNLKTVVIEFLGRFNTDLTVNFEEGWTLFPVKSSEPVSIDSLFKDAASLQIIKGYGVNEIYIPGVTSNFNLEPGKAYKARFSAPFSISFDDESQDNINVFNLDTVKDVVIGGENIKITPFDHIVYMEDMDNLSLNDTLLVYSTSEVCCGYGFVTKEGSVIVKAFGDDPTTDFTDGMLDNEKMKFYLLRGNVKYAVNYVFDKSTINYDLFVTDGFSSISHISLSPVGIRENNTEKIIVYPNPASDRVYVELNNVSSNCRYYVANVLGETVLQGDMYEGKTVIHIGELPKGIYIIRVKSDDLDVCGKVLKF